VAVKIGTIKDIGGSARSVSASERVTRSKRGDSMGGKTKDKKEKEEKRFGIRTNYEVV
jgi:hypothetical protein